MGKGAMKDGQGQGRRPRATDFAEVGACEGGLHADGRPKSATSQRLKQQSATIAELRGPDTTRLPRAGRRLEHPSGRASVGSQALPRLWPPPGGPRVAQSRTDSRQRAGSAGLPRRDATVRALRG